MVKQEWRILFTGKLFVFTANFFYENIVQINTFQMLES